MLTKETAVICPWCSEERSLEDWDNTTFGACISREQRRAFRSLMNKSVWSREYSKNFYKCPKCEQWSRGNKLKVAQPKTVEQAGLGGVPLIVPVDAYEEDVVE